MVQKKTMVDPSVKSFAKRIAKKMEEEPLFLQELKTDTSWDHDASLISNEVAQFAEHAPNEERYCRLDRVIKYLSD